MARDADRASPWVQDGGQWPLPWLAEPWQRAVAQRGHALLLYGPQGVGQFELALALAQTWLCEASPMVPPRPPCGRCDACRLLRTGAHPDLMVLVPESFKERLGILVAGEGGEEGVAAAKTKSGGREIRVADVRRAIDWGHQTSSRGRAKVLVLHPAQALNRVAANALLKTLEEPAGALRMVLSTADPQALLATLRSRCQAVSMEVPPMEVAVPWLESQGVDAAALMLRAAAGPPQEALAMVQDGLTARVWPDLPDLIKRHGSEAVHALQSVPVPRAVDALQKLCLDLMTRAMGQPAQYFPDECLPSGALVPALSRWWQALQRVARHDEHPWNAPLLIESLVLAGRQCWPAQGADGGGRRPAPVR